MRILFLHPNFPAQFRHLVQALAQDPTNQVVFGTNQERGTLPGVKKLIYRPTRAGSPEIHHYVKPLEDAVLMGQAVCRMAIQLKDEGWVPDVIYSHVGWGTALFIKDIFPETKLLGYFEWFYHAYGADSDFDPTDPLTPDDVLRIRIKNAPLLLTLYSCNHRVSFQNQGIT